jgi:hypothetical protein
MSVTTSRMSAGGAAHGVDPVRGLRDSGEFRGFRGEEE